MHMTNFPYDHFYDALYILYKEILFLCKTLFTQYKYVKIISNIQKLCFNPLI